jgi:dTDP-4-amino-4,6-dideoxygalactose transaminase
MTVKSIITNPFKINQLFEQELCEYTGAPFCVTVDSCTIALFLCAEYLKRYVYKELPIVTIPKRTYLSVPQSFLHAGYKIKFKDINWTGYYQLDPTPIIDSAKWLTSNMYIRGSLTCLCFHSKKHLAISRGGAILTDNKIAYERLKRMRYDGRGECNYRDDDITELGFNCYMSPEQAAHGLNLLANYPRHTEPLIEDPPYRDLTTFTVFKNLC